MAIELTILKGSTFVSPPISWGDSPLRYIPIEARVSFAPIRFKVPNHYIPDGWPVSIVGHDVISRYETYAATVLDEETIELNELAIPGLKDYEGGAYVVVPTPVDMTGNTARMHIRQTIDAPDPPILSLTTENGGIAIDNPGKFIFFRLTADETAAITVSRAVADLEMVSGATVERVAAFKLRFDEEVTR